MLVYVSEDDFSGSFQECAQYNNKWYMCCKKYSNISTGHTVENKKTARAWWEKMSKGNQWIQWGKKNKIK